MPCDEWYNSLAKPAWTPAPATIGLIWQILYPVILISFGFVYCRCFESSCRIHPKLAKVAEASNPNT